VVWSPLLCCALLCQPGVVHAPVDAMNVDVLAPFNCHKAVAQQPQRWGRRAFRYTNCNTN
jgi:hypothetical protein